MIEYKNESYNIKEIILEMFSNVVVNMIVIDLASIVFKNIYVENIFYMFLTALILMILNKCVKPLIQAIMLPINIYTLGLSYPFVNVFILKIVSIILKEHFILKGWFSAFFISIFVSIMTIIIDKIVGNAIRKV